MPTITEKIDEVRANVKSRVEMVRAKAGGGGGSGKLLMGGGGVQRGEAMKRLEGIRANIQTRMKSMGYAGRGGSGRGPFDILTDTKKGVQTPEMREPAGRTKGAIIA